MKHSGSVIPDHRYWQHVKNRAELYQKTYGTKSIEEMKMGGAEQ